MKFFLKWNLRITKYGVTKNGDFFLHLVVQKKKNFKITRIAIQKIPESLHFLLQDYTTVPSK
jgi:hypothetical protein